MSGTKHGKLFILCKDEALHASVASLAESLGWYVLGDKWSDARGADLLLAILDPRPADIVREMWKQIVSDVSSIDQGVRHNSEDDRTQHSKLSTNKQLDVSALEPLVDCESLPQYARLIFCSTTEKCDLRHCSDKGEMSKNSDVFQKYHFLLQSFPCNHIGLSSLPHELSDLLKDLSAQNGKLKSEPSYRRMYILYAWRMYAIIYHARGMGYAWATDYAKAMLELAKKAGDRESRLEYEHDIARLVTTVEGRKSLLEEHAKLDYYYLAACGPSKTSRKLACIDDQPGQFDHFLMLMSRVTGDEIFHSATEDDARSCIRSMSGSTPSLSGSFKRVGQADKTHSAAEVGIPDWLLVDLLIRDETGKRRIEGTRALGRFMETSPQTPAILLTWSEETDVAAQAMRQSNAVCVVSKRRILRVPYEMRRYMDEEVGPILNHLRSQSPDPSSAGTEKDLHLRMLQAYRLWTACPGILWHGEKTYLAAEHSAEHHKNLWKLVNQLLPQNWEMIRKPRGDRKQYSPDHLFRFLMAIWLHDIGSKGNENYQMPDQVRERHSWISGNLVHRNPELYFLERGEESDFVEILTAYHQSCAPFHETDKPAKSVRGLFTQSLERIEAHSKWPILEWTALLRLVDAVDYHWRRVGGEQLYQTKLVAIDMETRYYQEREREAQSEDARTYAEWLGIQEKHMKKHRAVLDANIHTRLVGKSDIKTDAEKGCAAYFWPEYTFTSEKSASDYLPGIGRYVLKEWYDTGDFIKTRMGLSIPNTCIVSNPKTPNTYPVWDPPGLKEVSAALNCIKKYVDRQKKDGVTEEALERESKDIGDRLDVYLAKLWMSKDGQVDALRMLSGGVCKQIGRLLKEASPTPSRDQVNKLVKLLLRGRKTMSPCEKGGVS